MKLFLFIDGNFKDFIANIFRNFFSYSYKIRLSTRILVVVGMSQFCLRRINFYKKPRKRNHCLMYVAM